MPPTPNRFPLVDQLAHEQPELLTRNTAESILTFMTTLGKRLVEEDPDWGFLTKTSGEKHLVLPNGQFIAVDSFIYKSTQQVVDILGNAVDPGVATPAWQEKNKRPDNNWYPINGPGPDPRKDAEQDKRISALEARIAELATNIAELERNAVMFGSKIGLRMSEGKVVCAEAGGPKTDEEPIRFATRSNVGAWESYRVERGY